MPSVHLRQRTQLTQRKDRHTTSILAYNGCDAYVSCVRCVLYRVRCVRCVGWKPGLRALAHAT